MIIFYEAVKLIWETPAQEKEWNDLVKEIKADKIVMLVTPHVGACTVTLSFVEYEFHKFSVTRNGKWRERLIKNLKEYRNPFLILVEKEKVAWRLE